MCVCTPSIRTPWCGKPGCQQPPPKDDTCPECGEPWKLPPLEKCVLLEPLAISIPAGKHIHLKCPVHGSHRLDGPKWSM